MIKKFEIRNSKGEKISLTTQEQQRAHMLQTKPEWQQFMREMRNSLGYEISITTLFEISKQVVEQKFFTIRPSEYMPLRVGNGAWASELLTYRDYQVAGDFEAGNINTGASNSRLAEADGGVDSLTNPIINWAKQVTWSFADLMMAARSGNWDIVTSKERSRKRNWDLGIQQIAFWGSNSNTSVMGLLTQANVNSNTSLITVPINTMTAAQFATFVAGIIGAYRANCAYTAMPTHFIIPELDYDGLITPVSSTYPNVSMITYLEDAFKRITMNPNFKVLPCAYASESQNSAITGLNKNRYTLLNYDEDSLAMDIPVDYTNTLQNTINGFQFQNVGYGQYTGVLAYRPLEMLYFDYAT